MKNTTTTTQDITAIKFALPEDIAQLVAFGYKGFEENGLKDLSIQPVFNSALLGMTDFVLNHAVLVKRNEEDPQYLDGAIVIQTTTLWWTDKPILYAVLTYVKPEKRSFKLASNLLKAAQEYAIMNEMSLVVDLFGLKDIARKQKLLRYLNFEELGSTYIFTGHDS